MCKFNKESGIRFVKKPVRIDLKFEKSFVSAMKAGKNDILELFPQGTIQSAFVSLHQVFDYMGYKDLKQNGNMSAREQLNEMISTPLHIAC